MKLWCSRGVWIRANTERKIKALSCADIKKVAILRHAALGDMVLTRSFIIEARKAFPNAIITLSIVSNYTRGTPEDLVDRVHIVHGSDNRNVSIIERFKRIKELGEQDIIIDLASSSRSTMNCLLQRATLKIGITSRRLQSNLHL